MIENSDNNKSFHKENIAIDDFSLKLEKTAESSISRVFSEYKGFERTLWRITHENRTKIDNIDLNKLIEQKEIARDTFLRIFEYKKENFDNDKQWENDLASSLKIFCDLMLFFKPNGEYVYRKKNGKMIHIMKNFIGKNGQKYYKVGVKDIEEESIFFQATKLMNQFKKPFSNIQAKIEQYKTWQKASDFLYCNEECLELAIVNCLDFKLFKTIINDDTLIDWQAVNDTTRIDMKIKIEKVLQKYRPNHFRLAREICWWD